MSAKPECTEGDCAIPAVAKGYCPKHYSRWKRHGDPNKAHRMVPRGSSLAERLEILTSRGGKCWLWEGTIHGSGYGVLQFEGTMKGAHVWAYVKAFGPVPDGLQILHSCDVKLCVNPAHLRAGTHGDNMTDKVERDRNARNRGEAGPNKITEKQAIRLIHLRAEGGYPYPELGRAFGISASQARNIFIGRNWPHLERPAQRA